MKRSAMKMTRILLFASLLLLSARTFSHPIILGDSAFKDSASSIYNYFHLDAKSSFFQWKEKPVDFEFKLVDHFGNVLAQSCNPDFIIDDALVVKKDRFRENEVYTFTVIIKDTAGFSRIFTGQVCCLGIYCVG